MKMYVLNICNIGWFVVYLIFFRFHVKFIRYLFFCTLLIYHVITHDIKSKNFMCLNPDEGPLSCVNSATRKEKPCSPLCYKVPVRVEKIDT